VSQFASLVFHGDLGGDIGDQKKRKEKKPTLISRKSDSAPGSAASRRIVQPTLQGFCLRRCEAGVETRIRSALNPCARVLG